MRRLIGLTGLILLVSSADALAQRSRRPVFPWFPDPTQKPLPILNTNVVSWTLEGTGYEFKCDALMFGCRMPVLRSRLYTNPTRGALMHREWAVPWRGATVEARAEIRAGSVEGEATLVIRALDGAGNTIAVASSPAMSGTTSFERHRVTLAVPVEAERLAVGLELSGKGAVFVRELRFDDSELFASKP